MFEKEKLIRPNILGLKPYTSARDEFSARDGIFLDANENPYGKYNRYPDPYQRELKAEISFMKNIPVKHIFLGNGSDEVIDLCLRIFCEPGNSKALCFTPTYGMYQVLAAIQNVKMIESELNPDFQIDQKSLLPRLIDPEIKMIFICSPNNPSGNLIDKRSIEFILKNYKGVVIIDEAYIDFASTDSWISRLSEFPNLIVTQTFSKAWGMAGARVGMAFADAEIISFLNKVKAPYNISTINQHQILKKLKQANNYESVLNKLIYEKNKLIKAFNALDGIVKVYPSDANFILIEVENANEVYERLLDKQIIVRNRNSIVRGCLRITVGKPTENKKLVQELKNILS